MMDDKRRNAATQEKAKKAVKVFVEPSSFKNDPNGSYTGQPREKGEKPVQDADDL